MNIAMIQSGVGIFGGVRRMIEISNNLVNFGHNVVWFTPAGVAAPWINCNFPFKVLALAKEGEWDVAVANRSSDEIVGTLLACNAKRKFFYVLGLNETALDFFGNVLLGIEETGDKQLKNLKMVLEHPDITVIANSTWQADFLNKTGFECHKVIGAVNQSMFKPVRLSKLEPPNFVLGTSGDPRYRKGLEYVEAAVEIIKETFPVVTLRKYHGLNLPQDQMAEWYSKNHVFLDGQLWAGWNNPVAESMACGVPVVATNIGGNKDFCEDDETAYLVPIKNPTHMARATLRLLKSAIERDRISHNALKVIKKFTWENCAKQLEDLF